MEGLQLSEEEIKTCQVKMHDEKPCGRPLWDGEKCICHSEESDKDRDLFMHEVQEQLSRDDLHDFTRFVFPKDYDFPWPELREGAGFELRTQEFRKNAYFGRARFLGMADFIDTRFFGSADFSGVKFLGVANFVGAQFSGCASFDRAKVRSTANFSLGRFHKKASFQAATFDGAVDIVKTQLDDVATFADAKFGGEADFKGTQFTGEADFRATQFDGGANFMEAQFSGRVIFSRAQFDVKAGFFGAEFSGDAYFVSACFDSEVDFRKARVVGDTDFVRTEFRRETQFSECRIEKSAYVRFDNKDGEDAMFQSTTFFTEMRLEEGAKLLFRKVSLEQCRLQGTDWRKVRFVDVEWPAKNGRQAVADELTEETPDWELVADVHRDIQENCLRSNRYNEATGFFVAEQQIRWRLNPRWSYRWPSLLYRIVSRYGQNYVRPLLWMCLTLGVLPATFLWTGIKDVQYAFSLWPSDCLLLTKDYWDTFFDNVAFLTFSRSDLTDRLLHSYQKGLAGLEMVLIVTLITFFLLALRPARPT